MLPDKRRERLNKAPYVLAWLLISLAMPGRAQHSVEVTVTGIRDTTGVIMVGLFRDDKSFLKKPFTGKQVRAQAGQIHVIFEAVAPAEYAVSIIHDANRNGKLDTNFLGIPREGFGFSNDAMGTFGPPSFEKAKFKVDTALRLHIRTRYL